MHVNTLSSSGYFRYRENNVTVAETPGVDATDLVGVSETAPTFMIRLKAGSAHYRGVEIIPFGRAGSASGTFTVEAIMSISDSGETSGPDKYRWGLDNQYVTRQIASVAYTTSTDAAEIGTAGGFVGSSDVLCGVITPTVNAYGTYLQTGLGAVSVVHQAAGIGWGSYMFSDVGPNDYLRICFILGGTATQANAIVCLFT